jgi:hypothetical protein
MKGDFSRFTFDPTKHYRNVLTQQGRVAVDADSNEQQFITSHRIETETADTIGISGAPIDPGKNFELKLNSNSTNLIISKGHYYVDGRLCINDTECSYITQPDCKMLLPDKDGNYLVYIDVWEKHITYLDDANIREKALGGPDTSTRLKTVWQVKHKPLVNDNPKDTINSLTNNSKVTLKATISQNSNSNSICSQTSISSGYNRRENQLYRVELHDNTIYKWSRDNGIIVTTCSYDKNNPVMVGNNELFSFTVDNIGSHSSKQFYQDQLVELIYDNTENNQLPGMLGKVVSVDTTENTRITIDLPDGYTPANNIKCKIRGWDGQGNIPKLSDTKLMLEDGLEIAFSFTNTSTFTSGDYWLIPLRGGVLLNDKPQEPHGIEHHYASLAIVSVNTSILEITKDLRNLFPSLTNLTSMFYVSGDGQQSMAGSPELNFPLCVGVANGMHPIRNANVTFKIKSIDNQFKGSLSNQKSFSDKQITTIIIPTDDKGIAQCWWKLASSPESQQVEAELTGRNNVPIRFTGYLRKNSDVDTVMRVINVSLGGQILKNDTRVDLESFLNDIIIECDSNIYQPSVRNKPVCFLTIHKPEFFSVQTSNAVYGYSPLILATSVFSDNKKLQIRLNNNAKDWLRSEFAGETRKLESGILVWLTLKGNYIWSEGKVPDSRIYLDGNVYGVHDRPSPPFTHIPEPIIDAQYSGDGKSGGDLEMWFWVTFESQPTPVIPEQVTPRVEKIEIFAKNKLLGIIQKSQPSFELLQDRRSPITRFQIHFSHTIVNDTTYKFDKNISLGNINFATAAPIINIQDKIMVVDFGTFVIPANTYAGSLRDVSCETSSGQKATEEFKYILTVR